MEKLVPKLRFPEFDGNWDERKLSDVAKITTGSTPPTNESKFYNGEYLFVSPADLNSGRYVYDTKTKVTKLGFEKGRVIKKGGVLFVSIGSTIGKVGQASSDCITNQQINSLEAKNDFSNDFIYSLLFKNGENINKIAGVQAVPQLNKTDFSNLKYNFPTLTEQQKIASFLTSVDERLTLLAQQKEKLELYKKGVMQQIFSQKLRFKDENGKEYPDWEEKKLGDVAQTKVTNFFSRENLNYEIGEVKNIHYGDIHTKFQTLFNIEKEYVPFINSDVSIKQISKENYCVEGDLIFADASEDLNDVGKSIEIVNLNQQKLLSGLHTILVRPTQNIFHKGFAGYLFKSHDIRLQIQKESQGSKVLSISNGRLLKIKINIPSHPEQQKIASFLSAIDVQIEGVSNKIEQTKLFKKGLLQQLFV